jgi:hypothetical protein
VSGGGGEVVRVKRAGKALTPTLSLRERETLEPFPVRSEKVEPAKLRPLSLRERMG